ncbi:MAG: PilZ domain-containing protein [Desulfobacterales bacterium]
MVDPMEKRRYTRYPHNASLTFSHFHSLPLSSKSSRRGEKLSHGEGGLQFRSAYPLKPGAILLIKLDRLEIQGLAAEAYSGMRTVSVGRVVWCRPLDDESGYTVGIQYFTV